MRRIYRKIHHQREWHIKRPISQQYDVEQAQRAFEKCLSLPNNIFLKDHLAENENSSIDPIVLSEYDVPRISFKFLNDDETTTDNSYYKIPKQKSDSDPNLLNDSTGEDLYKVPRTLCVPKKEKVRPKSVSLNTFETIQIDELLDTNTVNTNSQYLAPFKSLKERITTILHEQTNHHKVASTKTVQKDRIVTNLEQIFKRSGTKCRKAIFPLTKRPLSKPKPNLEAQSGFEDVRRYIKHGGDFCKELAGILQELADAEQQYSKTLQKISGKLTKLCRDSVGTINEAWKYVAHEWEQRADAHRHYSTVVQEETARPLRHLVETQQRTRKQCETITEKSGKILNDWRLSETKSKKTSHSYARDNERLQDAVLLDRMTTLRSNSIAHLNHISRSNTNVVEPSKMALKKKKAEDAVKKADFEYYSLCIRSERARLDWESSVRNGVGTFQHLEEERLNYLWNILGTYLQHSTDLGPKLIQAVDTLKRPIDDADPQKDLGAFINLRQMSQFISEQLLPDFYCEHITLAMNRDRRKQALMKLLFLVKQDIERERKSLSGLENLSVAIRKQPNFGGEDTQQSVTEKIYHMKSLLTYLEASRFKLQNALNELENRPKINHPLGPHITVSRDKSGVQHSYLKVPQWVKDDWGLSLNPNSPPLSEKSENSDDLIVEFNHEKEAWNSRGTADGISTQLDSDFDEFSSEENLTDLKQEEPHPIARCKALYAYTPNFGDELTLKPGDLLSVYRQQEDGWWLGECAGNVGIFPATYVEIIH